MIIGKVTTDLEVVIELVVIGLNRREKIEAVVDTGFSGYLALPGDLINLLKLRQIDNQAVILGDGTEVVLQKYLLSVLWHGEEHNVSTLQTDGGPLVGMSLLYGSRVILDVINGGDVSINAMP
ncbi:clan AA aspartic protease [Candidatus Poribacteria bacterium]|nr:clan AA aspartic protease [Candidatus Poribacteria bacterium]MXV81757.1 clan AA aspartic protease [Candidatus Poribacteria bacterium]MYA56010.1 clan AA aspartic protease [Candidatus Poribacteria bacterium]